MSLPATSEFIPYETVLKALDRANVRYLVVGGVAVNLHGYMRATKDMDLMIALDAVNIKKFTQTVENLGYRPIVPVAAKRLADPKERKKWKLEKGAIVFHFLHPTRHWDRIDVFLENPIPFSLAFKKRKILKLTGYKINLISFDDLVSLKNAAGRPQDLEDVDRLKRIRYRQEKE